MWVVNFVVVRDGARNPDDGSPRFVETVPFQVPDIDQSVVHRGEMFVVDDVVWDLERKTISVEIVPADGDSPIASVEIKIEDDAEEPDDDIESGDDTEPAKLSEG